LPFAATGLGANLQLRVAPLMLGAMATPAELGWFGAASRVGRAVRLAPQALLAGALPVLSREYGIDRSGADAVSRTIDRALTALSFCGAIALALLAAPLMRLLLGAPFAAAGPALIWVAIGLVPAVSNSSRKVYLFAAGGEALVLRWTTAALVIQVASAAALIPVFGAAGAAASVAVGEAAIWWPLRRANPERHGLKAVPYVRGEPIQSPCSTAIRTRNRSSLRVAPRS
jgi:O-antigen/teichoic acid export membrane protein